MSTNDELDLDQIDDNDPQAASNLRKYAERMKAQADGAKTVLKENDLLRAGIDTSTTLGKAFLATFQGDSKDAAAVLEAAKEFPGIIRGATAPSTEGETSANDGTQVTSTDQTASETAPTGTDQRRALADGATASAAAVGDPVTMAHETANGMIAKGFARDEAMAEAVANIARATADGKINTLDQFGRPRQ
jgi:hypothetical protein